MGTVTSADGTAIAFDRAGAGAPVVLVGGALRDRGGDAPLAALLAPSFTVYTYDRRGRGDSGDTPRYAVEREVEDLAAVIAEAGGSASVYGSSSGANLVLEAADAGLAIERMALHEPNFLVDDSRPPLPADYVARLDELIAAGRRGDAVALFMSAAVGLPPEFVSPMREMPMWRGMEAAAHTLAYDGTVVRGFAFPSERLASVAVPALLIDGGASDPWLRASAEAVAVALPDAQHRTLDGQQHSVAPEAVAPVLRTFFAG